MTREMLQNTVGAGAAVVVAVAGIWWLWGHAQQRKYGPDDTVTIAVFSNATEAQLCKSKLQAAGIECMLTGAEAIYARSMFLAAASTRRVRVSVLGRDVGRARQALSAFVSE